MQQKRENISQKRIHFSENVKNARKVCALTQAQFAEILGFNRDFVQSIENRGTQPKYEDLYLIANFFRIPIDDILFKSLSNEDLMKIKVNAKNSNVYIQNGDNAVVQKVTDSTEVYGNNTSSTQPVEKINEILEENNTLKTRVSFLEGQVQLLRELMGK